MKRKEMNLNTILESIKNVHEYTSTSQNGYLEVLQMEKMQLNISTMIALMKLKAFEVEYFSKFGENGFACIAVKLILNHPPSKTWLILGKELVSLLQYWLRAIQNYLISHNPLWWSFLEVILNFIKEIRQKHSTIPNILLEQTAEYLLNLSTNDKCDECQKFEILHCMNTYCAESTREIRFTLRNKFSQYFIKLSNYMSSCGHLPCQFIIMETLLRWLVPRHNHDVRSTSASKWFPRDLYSQKTVDIFLERPWINFFQDARDFLNSHNETNDLIESFVCKKLFIGDEDFASGMEKQDLWLDINTMGRCISIFLEPDILDKLGVTNHRASEVLIISFDNTNAVQLYSESNLITIKMTTLSTPEIIPSSIKIAKEEIRTLKAVLSSRNDLIKLDKALRNIFANKYQLMMDLKRKNTLSPQQKSQNSLRTNRSDDEVKFSQPVAKIRGRRSANAVDPKGHLLFTVPLWASAEGIQPQTGYVVKSKKTLPLNSPSSTSTTSLAHLRERLEALPGYKYNNNIPVKVCESPNLTKVTEISETDDRQTLSSVTELRLTTSRCHGVRYKNIRESSTRTSQNAIEVNLNIKDKSLDKKDDHSTSCLLIATIGSTDESVISNTVERLSKSKEYKSDNIVDLLIKEAFHNKNDIVGPDKINTISNKEIQRIDENNEAIENTICSELKTTREKQDKINFLVRKRSSSTDGSNANIINETPVNNVTFRAKNLYRNKKQVQNVLNANVVNKDIYDETNFNDFFKQDVIDNSDDNIVQSSTLAIKINETIPDTSESLNDNIINNFSCQNNFMLNDVEVSECLNSIIDKVCNDFQQDTIYLNSKRRGFEEIDKIYNYEEDTKELSQKENNNNTSYGSKVVTSKFEKMKSKSQKKLQLKFQLETRKENQSKIKNVSEKYKKQKEEIVTTVVEEDASVKNDKLIKLPNRNTKGTYNRKNTSKAKSPDLTSIREDNTKVNDVICKENTIHEDLSLILCESSPQENEKKTTTDAVRRRRKLYSPIIETANNEPVTNDDENIPLSNFKVKPKTLNFNAYSYKAIEQERQNYSRRPRFFRSKSIAKIQSPRTQKNNDVFDKLKGTIENTNEIFVKVKSTNDVYNFTSDSDDVDLKPKNIRVPKQTAAAGNIDPTLSRTREIKTKRQTNKQNASNTKKNKTKTTKSNKVTKVERNRSNKRKINIPETDLVDETMRKSKGDILNTSFIITRSNNKANDDPVPVLSEVPQLEDYNVHDKQTKTKESSKKRLSVKKDDIHKTLTDDRTQSPLPQLIIEATALVRDDDSDIIRPDFFKSLKKKQMNSVDLGYLNKTKTTQHKPLDSETIHLSEHIVDDDIQADIDPINIDINICKNNLNNTRDSEQEVIEIPEFDSEKSIATNGITAHGDMEESPPSMKYIEKAVTPRNLELEDLNKSTQDYYKELKIRINQSERNSRCSSLNRSEGSLQRTGSQVEKIPRVMLSRLTSDDIKKVLKSNVNLSRMSIKSDKTIQRHSKSKISDKGTPIFKITKNTLTSSNRCLSMSSDDSKKNAKTNTNKAVSNDCFIIKSNKQKRLLAPPSSSDSDFEDNVRNLRRKLNSSRVSKTGKDISNKQKEVTSEKENSPRAEVNRLKLNDNTLEETKRANINAVDTERTEGLNVNYRTASQLQQRKSVISPIRLEFPMKYQTQPLETTKAGVAINQLNLLHNLNIRTSVHNTFTPTSGKLMIRRDSESIESNRALSEVNRLKLKRKATVVNDLSNVILDVTPSTSNTTVFSVNEWFDRNDALLKDANATNTTNMVDILKNVYERVDTALANNDAVNTETMFNILIEFEKRSQEQKEKSHTMSSECIEKIMDQVRKIVERTFADYENNLQSMYRNSRKEFRQSVSDGLVKSAKRKRAIKRVLKHDIITGINQFK